MSGGLISRSALFPFGNTRPQSGGGCEPAGKVFHYEFEPTVNGGKREAPGDRTQAPKRLTVGVGQPLPCGVLADVVMAAGAEPNRWHLPDPDTICGNPCTEIVSPFVLSWARATPEYIPKNWRQRIKRSHIRQKFTGSGEAKVTGLCNAVHCCSERTAISVNRAAEWLRRVFFRSKGVMGTGMKHSVVVRINWWPENPDKVTLCLVRMRFHYPPVQSTRLGIDVSVRRPSLGAHLQSFHLWESSWDKYPSLTVEG